MKQLILMIVLTGVGALGGLFFEPFLAIAVYYLFAVLRPQYLWEWTLPIGVRWSFYVGVAALVGVFLRNFSAPQSRKEEGGSSLAWAHWPLVGFAIWQFASFVVARNRFVARGLIEEYAIIFVMYAATVIWVRDLRRLRALFLIAAGSVGWIAIDVNHKYFSWGRVDMYHEGYAGLDSNGAGLMLAMALPLCVFAWEAYRKWWRWLYLACAPLLVHGVLMTYSRGAMLSLLLTSPLLVMRFQKKRGRHGGSHSGRHPRSSHGG